MLFTTTPSLVKLWGRWASPCKSHCVLRNLERRVGNAPTQYHPWQGCASLLGQRRIEIGAVCGGRTHIIPTWKEGAIAN